MTLGSRRLPTYPTIPNLPNTLRRRILPATCHLPPAPGFPEPWWAYLVSSMSRPSEKAKDIVGNFLRDRGEELEELHDAFSMKMPRPKMSRAEPKDAQPSWDGDEYVFRRFRGTNWSARADS